MSQKKLLIGLVVLLVSSTASAISFLRIKCDAEDVGATVFINDKEVGGCPVDAPAPAGKVTIRAWQAAGADHEKLFFKEIKVIDGVPQRIDIVMSPPQLTAEAVRRNEAVEAQNVQRAAERGDLAAMLVLIQRYEKGIGFSRNPQLANEWRQKHDAATVVELTKKAEAAEPDAMAELAGRYERGDSSVRKDEAQAQVWRSRIPAARKEWDEQKFRPKMIPIPAGTFGMGMKGQWAAEPVHTVNVPAFLMAQTEVTQAQWQAVMGNNPSQFKGCETCPVEQVSWNDVQVYLQKLNALTGKAYRLPSEAEWEYACRAGRNQDYCGSDNVDAVAWPLNNSDKKLHPVGQKHANAFGLHDMSGNVWEWVQDCWNQGYSGLFSSAPNDGSAWSSGNCEIRGRRGGSWGNRSQDARSVSRAGNPTGIRFDVIGFRVALSSSIGTN